MNGNRPGCPMYQRRRRRKIGLIKNWCRDIDHTFSYAIDLY
jgi:hypothetical protein